jgi:CO/xanthine dehydrogenase FAD-binding subunit
MIDIQQYVKPETIQEAFDLNQDRKNLIIAGMLWTKMGSRSINTAIDLSGLGLDKIEDKGDYYKIGAMVSLRQLEINEQLNELTNGAINECMKHIVGVQFRNIATIGGSLFGRYGFSDPLTLFLALDARVELYEKGIVSLREFNTMRPDRDLLVSVLVDKNITAIKYKSIRNNSTDFPVLTCSVSKINGTYCTSIGARPLKAIEVVDEDGLLNEMNDENINTYIEKVKTICKTGTNQRGTSEYRTKMIGVLTKRLIKEIVEDESKD